MWSRPVGSCRRVSVVALALIAGLTLSGCGASSSGAAGRTGSSAATKGDFGPAVTLEALNGQPIEVTLLQVEDPATSDDPTLTPGEGKRYVAGEFRLRNTGQEGYADTPSNGTKVIGTTDAEWGANLFDPVAPGFGSLTIAPGTERTGWITFEVPQGVTLRTVRFVTNSGFGSDAEWSLR
jgi:hypothetical protein